jgi:alkaline phosphatase
LSRPVRPLLVRFLATVGLLAILWMIFSLATGRATVQTDLHPVELERVAPVVDPTEIAVDRRPDNIILVIADGLGFAHLAAGRAALHGIDGAAAWDALPVVGWHSSHPVDGLIADSASAATALATGYAAHNGFIGVDATGRRLRTLFERAAALGYRTGLVTDSYVWDATPAAFVTHVNDRDQAAAILEQLATAKLDVLFGELVDVGRNGVPTWAETEALLAERYEVFGPGPVTTEELVAVDAEHPVAAIFEQDQITDLGSTPTLPALERAALQRLARSGEPFILLVESEEVDSASHRHDLERSLRGIEVIEAVLDDIVEFARRDGNTLVLFTSDHETGALAIGTTSGNLTLRAIWGSAGHTAVPVPLMALGPGSELFAGTYTNAQVGQRLFALLRPPALD